MSNLTQTQSCVTEIKHRITIQWNLSESLEDSSELNLFMGVSMLGMGLIISHSIIHSPVYSFINSGNKNAWQVYDVPVPILEILGEVVL